MKPNVSEHKTYLRMIYGYIKDFLPSLLLIYGYTPTANMSFSPLTYIVTTVLLASASILSITSENNKKRWLYSLLILTALLMVQDVIIVFLYSMLFIYLIFLLKVRKVINYLIDLLIFIFLLVVITSILLKIPYAIKIEEAIVAVLLITVALYLAGYTIKISLDILKYFSILLSGNKNEIQIVPIKRLNNFLKSKFSAVIIISIIFLLLLPDFIYAWFMYDLYFSLFPKDEFSFLSRFFYAISNHFNIDLDSVNRDKMDNLLLSTKSGNFIKIVHIVLLKLIDTIILGAIVGVFVEFLKSFASKQRAG